MSPPNSIDVIFVSQQPDQIATLRYNPWLRSYTVTGISSSTSNKKTIKTRRFEEAYNVFHKEGFQRMDPHEEQKWIDTITHQEPKAQVVMVFHKTPEQVAVGSFDTTVTTVDCEVESRSHKRSLVHI